MPSSVVSDSAAVTDSNSESVVSVQEIEQACTKIMESNFDSDTKVCFITIIKMLDNILLHPYESKYRTINTINNTFQKKIGHCKNSLLLFKSCGFVGLSNNNNTNQQQLVLNLPELSSSSSSAAMDDNRKVIQKQLDILFATRRLLRRTCIEVFGCKPDDVPDWHSKQPPTVPIVLSASASDGQQQQNSNTNSTGFNPYVGFRYDAQSAVTGISTTPGPNYISPTESTLNQLQNKEKQFAEQLKRSRESNTTSTTTSTSNTNTIIWKAYRRDEQVPILSTTSTTTVSEGSGIGIESDSAMLVARQKKQIDERQRQQDGGFTTRAMREVQRLTKQKLYKSTILTITFPDGIKLLSTKFLPYETIGTVIESILSNCIIGSSLLTPPSTTSAKKTQSKSNNNDNNSNNIPFDLFITPPRRILQHSKTLLEEGLVPAAKVYICWKPNRGPINTNDIDYINPLLFEQQQQGIVPASAATTTANVVAFPTGQSLVLADKKTSIKDDDTNMDTKKPAATKPKSREEDLLRRMMGGSSRR